MCTGRGISRRRIPLVRRRKSRPGAVPPREGKGPGRTQPARPRRVGSPVAVPRRKHPPRTTRRRRPRGRKAHLGALVVGFAGRSKAPPSLLTVVIGLFVGKVVVVGILTRRRLPRVVFACAWAGDDDGGGWLGHAGRGGW